MEESVDSPLLQPSGQTTPLTSERSEVVSPLDEADDDFQGEDTEQDDLSAQTAKQKKVRDVPCTQCGRFYSSENSLRNHIRIKHSYQPTRQRAQSADGCVAIRAKAATPPHPSPLPHSVTSLLAGSSTPPARIAVTPDHAQLAAPMSNPETARAILATVAYPASVSMSAPGTVCKVHTLLARRRSMTGIPNSTVEHGTGRGSAPRQARP